MGVSASIDDNRYQFPGNINSKIQHKISQFQSSKSIFLKTLQPLKTYAQLQSLYISLRKSIRISISSAEIPLIQLHNYLLSNLGQNFYQDKDFLRQKRRELFEFVKQNLCAHQKFVFFKIIKILNNFSQQMLNNLSIGKLPVIKVIINVSLELLNALLNWLYGDQIFNVFIDKKGYQETDQSIIELYRNQLAEYVIFFQESDTNHLLSLRQKQVHFLSVKIKDKLDYKTARFKKSQSLKDQLMNEEKLSYSIILNLIERMAKANLFTTKYKLLCILFDTIPIVYLQQEAKHSKSLYKTTSQTPEKNKSITQTFLVHKTFEVESELSNLISVEKKRQISRVMLHEWMLSTNRDIIVDVLVPLKLLQQDGYIQQIQTFLHAFLHGLYEIVEVDENKHSEIF